MLVLVPLLMLSTCANNESRFCKRPSATHTTRLYMNAAVSEDGLSIRIVHNKMQNIALNHAVNDLLHSLLCVLQLATFHGTAAMQVRNEVSKEEQSRGH